DGGGLACATIARGRADVREELDRAIAVPVEVRRVVARRSTAAVAGHVEGVALAGLHDAGRTGGVVHVVGVAIHVEAGVVQDAGELHPADGPHAGERCDGAVALGAQAHGHGRAGAGARAVAGLFAVVDG